MKGFTHKCYIDSIRIRIDTYTDFKNIFYGSYKYRLTKYGKYLFYKIIDGKHYIIFEYEKRKDTNDNTYTLITFNGFKKYKKRDSIIEENFYFIINELLQNNITYYLSKIDLAVDFYEVELLDLLDIERKKEKRVKRVLLKDQGYETLCKIKNNDITFYFEEFVKDESRRKHRAYLYNKSKKEKLKKESVYRFEIEIKLLHEVKDLLKEQLREIELLKLCIEFDERRNIKNKDSLKLLETLDEKYSQDLKDLLLAHIKETAEKYNIKCMYENIIFDYTIVQDILELTINIKSFCNDININK